MVKKAAKQLLSTSSEQQFTTLFAHNKRILGSTMPSKPIRNKIAGYIARLKKAKQYEAEREARRSLSAKSVTASSAPLLEEVVQ
jgi:ribosomal protein S17E